MKFEIDIDPDQFIEALVLAANDLNNRSARNTIIDVRKQAMKALVAKDEPKTDVDEATTEEKTTLSGNWNILIDILTYCAIHVAAAEARVVLHQMTADLSFKTSNSTPSVTFAISPTWLLEMLVETREDLLIGGLPSDSIIMELQKFIMQCKSEEERALLEATK